MVKWDNKRVYLIRSWEVLGLNAQILSGYSNNTDNLIKNNSNITTKNNYSHYHQEALVFILHHAPLAPSQSQAKL